MPYAYPGKCVRRLSRFGRSRRRRRNPNFLCQVRQSAERLGGHERSPLVISNFQQIGPQRGTKLLQKVRMQLGLLAHEQKYGDSPPRRNLTGVEQFDTLIFQQIQ
jgi:hypothetical protein